MLFHQDYLEFNPSKKNRAWMQRVVTNFRNVGYHQIIDPLKAKRGRDILNSQQSLANIEKAFKNPEKMKEAGFEFSRICIMERLKNILISEKMKQEIKAYVDSHDPSLERMKKEDRELLKNKKLIETQVNSLTREIGLPPKKLGNDDFNGNYKDFEHLGLDSNDSSDVDTFMDIFYKLDLEMVYQLVINHCISVNAYQDLVYDFCEDMMAVKMLAWRDYVNKLTGAITHRRIVPETLFRIKGQSSKNQKGDIAVGYYEAISVGEFLKRSGSSFEFAEHWEYLVNSINSFNSTTYTGIKYAEGVIYGDERGACDYSAIINYQVQVGYMEFKSIDADQYENFVNKWGNEKVSRIKDDEPLKKKEYNKLELFRERTYCTDFLTTTGIEQFCFNSGLLYHQGTEGIEDEYSNYSIKYIMYQGKTIAEVAESWVNMANEAFNKFKFILRKTKQDGTKYNLQSLIEVAKGFLGGQGDPASVMQVFEMFEDSVNEIWSFPMVAGQPQVSGMGDMNLPKTDTFDTKFKSFKEIIDWAIESIKSEIGLNDLRSGESPNTNDVYKLEKASMEQSNNATYYMDDMMDYMYRNSGIQILSFVSDILRYKDTLPYNYILNVVGEDSMKILEAAPKIAPHRMDIFVSSFANVQDRIQVLKDTEIAFQKGLIDYSTKILVNNVNDHRKAQKLLMVQEQKAKKEAQKALEAQQQYAMQLEDKKTQNELLIVNTRGQWELKKTQVMAEGYIRAAQEQVEGKLNQIDKSTDAEKQKDILKHQLEQQEKFS